MDGIDVQEGNGISREDRPTSDLAIYETIKTLIKDFTNIRPLKR